MYTSYMTFEDIQQRAIEVRQKYDKLNATRNGAWNGQDLMAGFVGDVGDLSKIIMAKHGLRPMEDMDGKLAHELADCLWSVLVLAEAYGVDLAAEFTKTMDQLDAKIDLELQAR